MATNPSYSYPDASIDPRKKGVDWLLKYSRAAFYDRSAYMPISINNATIGNQKMAEIRLYALGKQPINKYRKVLNGTEQEDNTWLNLDWSVANILSKFREIAISKILQQIYDVQAKAIDPLSKTQEDMYFNQMKVKIQMRQELEKAGSPLADHPLVVKKSGEPEDEEQLEIDMEYGYKTEMCMEAEEGISLILNKNNSEEKRKSAVEDWYDFGLAGYKEWIDENGMVKYRAVNPENSGISYCQERDFSDAVHAYEAILVQLNDLSAWFSRDQMIYICKNVAGKWGNPQSFTPTLDRFWDSFKVLVCDLQLITFDTYVFEDRIDSAGNERFGKTDYNNIKFVKGGQFPNQQTDGYDQEPSPKPADQLGQGSATPKYSSTTKKEKYKIKWLVGTDFAYDYGVCENQGRKESTWWDVKLDYHFYAWNFNKMSWSGITERLIPIQDNYQLTWMRLQNLKASLIPYLIKLDLDALENVALGKGGADMTPKDIVDFMFQKNVFVYRSGEVFNGKQANYNPVDIIPSGQLQAFTQLYQDLQFSIQQMRDISGLNEVTDGSSPNEKMLTTGLELANQGTNNAIWMIMDADKKLLTSLYDGIIQKIQIAVKLGKVEGYTRALGTGTVKFLQINPAISLCEFGIFVNPVPTAEERTQLLSELNLKDSQGLIDPSDKIIVMGCTNLKQAAKLLAYRVKKRQEQQQQFQLQQVQAKQQGEAQTAMQLEQMKQQTIQMQGQIQLEVENTKGMWLFKTELMKKTSDQAEAKIQADAKTVGNQIQADAKKDSAHIAAGSHIAGTHMKGTADLLMTQMDNETAEKTAAAKKKTA